MDAPTPAEDDDDDNRDDPTIMMDRSPRMLQIPPPRDESVVTAVEDLPNEIDNLAREHTPIVPLSVDQARAARSSAEEERTPYEPAPAMSRRGSPPSVHRSEPPPTDVMSNANAAEVYNETTNPRMASANALFDAAPKSEPTPFDQEAASTRDPRTIMSHGSAFEDPPPSSHEPATLMRGPQNTNLGLGGDPSTYPGGAAAFHGASPRVVVPQAHAMQVNPYQATAATMAVGHDGSSAGESGDRFESTLESNVMLAQPPAYGAVPPYPPAQEGMAPQPLPGGPPYPPMQPGAYPHAGYAPPPPYPGAVHSREGTASFGSATLERVAAPRNRSRVLIASFGVGAVVGLVAIAVLVVATRRGPSTSVSNAATHGTATPNAVVVDPRGSAPVDPHAAAPVDPHAAAPVDPHAAPQPSTVAVPPPAPMPPETSAPVAVPPPAPAARAPATPAVVAPAANVPAATPAAATPPPAAAASPAAAPRPTAPAKAPTPPKRKYVDDGF